MKNNPPTVIDSQDCLGSFGERIGRVYTLCMANNALRQAYIPWSEGAINYSFARYITVGMENTSEPQAHLTRDGRQELPELLKSFDALPKAQRASSMDREIVILRNPKACHFRY